MGIQGFTKCATHEKHECLGEPTEIVGAYPVCANGAVAEHAARERHDARLNAWLALPETKRLLAEEAATERRIEFRP